MVGQTAWGLVVAAIIVWAVLPWVPCAEEMPRTDRTLRLRFTTRTMFRVTTGIACFLALAMTFPRMAGGGIWAIAFCHVVWFWSRFPQSRWQTIVLLACMWLPLAWFIAWFQATSEFLWISAAGPALFPVVYVGSWFWKNPHDVMWLAVLFTGAEMTIGTWMIRLGPRLTMAYLVFLLLISTFGSFVLYAAMRA